MTVNIDNLANAQAMGWADALITRNAAGRVGMPALALAQGAITTNIPALDISATWNNGLTVFNGIKANIIDTASAGASLLMDLQVGGVSRFHITKSGNANIVGSQLQIGAAGAGRSYLNTSLGLVFGSGLYLGWSSNVDAAVAVVDASIFRDAADIVAQRRGTNAQAFRVYNTFTDASNYERGFMRWNANVLQFGSDNGGTGAARIVEIVGNNDVKLVVNNGTGSMAGLFTSTGVGLVTGRGLGDVVILGSNLKITSLPTTDPAISGRIWNDAGTLKISP